MWLLIYTILLSLFISRCTVKDLLNIICIHCNLFTVELYPEQLLANDRIFSLRYPTFLLYVRILQKYSIVCYFPCGHL